MPRTKKPPGKAVDPRNGRRVEVGASCLERFNLPSRPKGHPKWRLETKRAWAALWDDESLSGVLLPVDRPVLLRWADSIDRAAHHLELGDADPIAKGSMGQAVESPHYGIADKALKVAAQCEAQLGVGALNRARLGLALTSERASLEDLNARLRRPADAPRRADPRVVPGSVER